MSKENNTSYISNPFKVIFKGFENLFKYNQNLSIILLISSVLVYGGTYINSSSSNFFRTSEPTKEQIIPLLLIIGFFILIFIPIYIFFIVMYNGISAYTIIKTNQEQTTTFKEAWNTTLQKFWIILGVNIIVTLKIIGGIILFVIPGVRASLRYNLVYIFIFDNNSGVSDAIRRSKNLTKGHLTEIFGMNFASVIIPIVGGLMAIGGKSIIYRQLTQLQTDSSLTKPSVHWLNYLGFVLFGVFLLFIAFIVVIIILMTNLS